MELTGLIAMYWYNELRMENRGTVAPVGERKVMTMEKARRGVYAAAISPFNSDGTLDSQKLVDYCKFLISEGGCDGVAPTGTTGEATSIGIEDRLNIPAVFAASGIASDRVIFGTGSCSVADTSRLTSAAIDAGYFNVLVLPPFYYKNPSDQGLYEFYARLVEKIADNRLRLYLYHFPQMSQIPLSADLVARLKKDFGPVIAGLKDSSGDFKQSRAFVEATGGVKSDFDVYPANELFLFDGLNIGCAGIISGSTNLTGSLVQAATSSSSDEREDIWENLTKARALAAELSMIPVMKQLQSFRSGDDTWLNMLPPNRILTEEQVRTLKGELECFGTQFANQYR